MRLLSLNSMHALQFLRELHFIEAPPAWVRAHGWLRRSSLGNCTSLRHAVAAGREAVVVAESRFLRELHFIEAAPGASWPCIGWCRSFFGNCTSLRRAVLEAGPQVLRVAVSSGTALH